MQAERRGGSIGNNPLWTKTKTEIDRTHVTEARVKHRQTDLEPTRKEDKQRN